VKAIAIDPGGTTGWCTFEVETYDSTGDVRWHGKTIQDCFEDAGQLEGDNHHKELRALLRKERPDILIVERFENRNNDFALLISCEYIGVCKEYAQTERIVLVMQGASQAFGFDDAGQKLERLGLVLKPYKRWKDANAARKHMVFFLSTQQKYPRIRMTMLLRFR
jgi:hypothetical protein